MWPVDLVLLVAAAVCFVLAAATVPTSPRLNLMALGLLFWELTELLGLLARAPIAR